MPQMPDTDYPKIDEWVSFLKNLVGEPDEETYFVGHSIGVQTILRYLEGIDKRVGGALSVAGFFTLIPGSLDDEEMPIAKPWLETPVNTEKIKNNVNAITAVFSDDDPYVGLENRDLFKVRLNAKAVVFESKGHFSKDPDITEFQPIFDELMAIINK